MERWTSIDCSNLILALRPVASLAIAYHSNYDNLTPNSTQTFVPASVVPWIKSRVNWVAQKSGPGIPSFVVGLGRDFCGFWLEKRRGTRLFSRRGGGSNMRAASGNAPILVLVPRHLST